MLFLGDYITKFKDKITLKSKDTYVDNMLTMLGMENCKPTSTPMVRKEPAANDDQEMLERFRGRNASVSCGHLDVFQETPIRLALRGKISGNVEFLSDQEPHETFETSFALHSRHAKHASGIGSAPRTVDGIGWLVLWIVGRPRRKTEVDCWWSVDAWKSVRGTQKPTALSSGESEFYSATVCACELLWACEFLGEMGYTMTACLKEDASACIGMATRLGPGRLKHVEIKHFALQHWVRQGRLNLDKVTTTEQLADIMTKPYSFQTLPTLVPKIGLTKCVTDH